MLGHFQLKTFLNSTNFQSTHWAICYNCCWGLQILCANMIFWTYLYKIRSNICDSWCLHFNYFLANWNTLGKLTAFLKLIDNKQKVRKDGGIWQPKHLIKRDFCHSKEPHIKQENSFLNIYIMYYSNHTTHSKNKYSNLPFS